MEKEVRNFVQKGHVIEVRRDIPTEKLTSRDIINQIKAHRDELNKLEESRVKYNEQLVIIDGKKEHVETSMKDFTKFEEWANTYQESKARAIVDDFLEKCVNEVDAEYVTDNTLDNNANKRQKFMQVQRKIATCDDARTDLAEDTIRKVFYEDCIFSNPWILEDEE